MALIRSVFQDELDGVSQSLVDLTDMVAVSIAKATESILNCDLKLAEEVIASDDTIDEFQHALDARIIDIIARQQPVASDLRALVTALRMSADLERMGDMSHHVAKITRLRHPDAAIPAELIASFKQMGEAAEKIANKFACFKRDFLSAPIWKAMKAVVDKTAAPKPCQIDYRKDEKFWVFPSAEDVSVTFEVNFQTVEDQSLARIFLLELNDSKRSVMNAPGVIYHDKTMPENVVRLFPGAMKARTSNGSITF